jgi:hypothetical protein
MDDSRSSPRGRRYGVHSVAFRLSSNQPAGPTEGGVQRPDTDCSGITDTERAPRASGLHDRTRRAPRPCSTGASATERSSAPSVRPPISRFAPSSKSERRGGSLLYSRRMATGPRGAWIRPDGGFCCVDARQSAQVNGRLRIVRTQGGDGPTPRSGRRREGGLRRLHPASAHARRRAARAARRPHPRG